MVKEQEFLAVLHDDVKYMDQCSKDLLLDNQVFEKLLQKLGFAR